MNTVDVQKLKYKGFSDEDIKFIDSICQEYGLDVNDLHLHKENNKIYYSLDYRFFISLAIKNGLKSVVVTQDDNFINVKLEREGFNNFEYSLDKRTLQKGNVSSIMLNKTAISNALKILFADVFSKYNHFGILPRKDRSKTEQFYQDYKNNPSYTNKNVGYTQKNSSATSNVNIKSNVSQSSTTVKSDISAIREKINNLQSKYNLDKETFYEIVKDAKKVIFDDENAKIDNIADYNRLYNYLSKFLEAELGEHV